MIRLLQLGVEYVKNLRSRFERFCFRNQNKGIPNLMLYITLGSAIVYLLSLFDQSDTLYRALCFDRGLILQGQVWRLFTYVFTFDAGHILLTSIALFCYYTLGRSVEMVWGTFRFNLFYFSGVLMMDIFCMLLGGAASVIYLNTSLFLAYATMFPEARFLLLYIIPVKAWIFAVVDLALTIYSVFMLTVAGLFPYSLFPLVAIANYFLFFGKDVVNIIPLSWRMKLGRKKPKPQSQKSVVFRVVEKKENYNHKCVVCGRTDSTNPELEFRYCSRCSGYYCYCQEHINNHTHIQ